MPAPRSPIGRNALQDNSTGIANIAVGHWAGSSLTTGNFNIAIGANGFAGEANTTRLGTGQTRAFIAGVRGRVATFKEFTEIAGLPEIQQLEEQYGLPEDQRAGL